MIEYKNILDTLHWQVEEKKIKISENFRSVIFDIHKSDNEKINELFVIYQNTFKKDENKDLLFIYNLKIELLKFLFEETRFYSDNNDSKLFSLYKNNILFSSEQLFKFGFLSDLDSNYRENIFSLQLHQQKYEILSKVQLWYSYNCTLIIEDLVLSSEFPKITRQEITKFLKHKIVNLKDKILNEQEFLDWYLTLKNRYLLEIKEIEHSFIKLESLSLDNNLPKEDLDFEKDIFRSLKAQHWFYDTLETLGVGDGGYRFNTIIGEIFRNQNCKENIFPYNLSQQEYINYLNKKFNKTMNPTGLRKETNHESTVETLIKVFMKNISE